MVGEGPASQPGAAYTLGSQRGTEEGSQACRDTALWGDSVSWAAPPWAGVLTCSPTTHAGDGPGAKRQR